MARYMRKNLLLSISVDCVKMKSNRYATSQVLPEVRTHVDDPFRNMNVDVSEMLHRRNYFRLPLEGDTEIGLLGRETITNWMREWWRCSVINNNDLIGIPSFHGHKKDNSYKELLQNVLSQETIQKLFETQRQLPLGVAVNVSHDDVKCNPGKLLTILFVDKSSADLTFDSWHSSNIKWIKKYLRRPAQLTRCSNNETSAHRQENAVYTHDNVQYGVQMSSLLHYEQLYDVESWVEIEKRLHCCPAVILIEHDLLNLFVTTLLDSYHTITFPNYSHRMLRIHPYLAPVKTAVFLEGGKTNELEQLAKEVCSLIKEMNITCWNANALNLSYADLDESGVVHGIVISEETLENGLLYVRSRDTSLKVQTHISELGKKLFRHLEPR